MIEYLVSFVQCLCLFGYLYGAWLVITHNSDVGPRSGHAAASTPPESRIEDQLAWRRYIAFDW